MDFRKVTPDTINFIPIVGNKILHTYHLPIIPNGVAEAYQIFLRDAHILPK
jgi:hypothetical protein